MPRFAVTLIDRASGDETNRVIDADTVEDVPGRVDAARYTISAIKPVEEQVVAEVPRSLYELLSQVDPPKKEREPLWSVLGQWVILIVGLVFLVIVLIVWDFFLGRGNNGFRNWLRN